MIVAALKPDFTGALKKKVILAVKLLKVSTSHSSASCTDFDLNVRNPFYPPKNMVELWCSPAALMDETCNKTCTKTC